MQMSTNQFLTTVAAFFLLQENKIHSLFIMNKERFTQFESDFDKFIKLMKEGNEVDFILENLVEVYPELKFEYELPDLVKAPVTIKEKSVQKDNPKLKNIEDITKKLMASVVDQKPWRDYTTIQINMENEEACLHTLRKLDEAEDDARKRIIYFSCLKGQVLQRLKEISGKKMNQLLRITNYSQGHVYLLIKLHKLALEFNKLMYSNLKLGYFKANFREIETICKSNELFFK